MSEGEGDIRSSCQGVGEPGRTGVRAGRLGAERGLANNSDRNGCHSGGQCLKIPPLIFFLLIFLFFISGLTQIKGFGKTEHQPLPFLDFAPQSVANFD